MCKSYITDLEQIPLPFTTPEPKYSGIQAVSEKNIVSGIGIRYKEPALLLDKDKIWETCKSVNPGKTNLSGFIIQSEFSYKRRNTMQIAQSLFYFVLAGLCEIGGGYLVWLWLREGKNVWYGLTGAFILVLYGIIPTLQPAHFGRVYAAYGGIFIALSLLWGWLIDGMPPDKYDLIGGTIALVGVFIMMYSPR